MVLHKKRKSMRDEKHSNEPREKEKNVSIIQLFKYSDRLDTVLLIIGTFSALASAAIFPLMFLLYGQISGIFIDLKRSTILSNTTTTTTNNNSNSSFCFTVSNSNTDYDARIREAVMYYVMGAFGSLLMNHVAHACWSTASERQCKRIRNMLFESIMRQEMAFFDKYTPGDLNSRITTNINNLQNAFGYKFADTIMMSARALACFIVAMSVSWKLSIVFIGLTPLVSVFMALMIVMVKKYTIKEFKAYSKSGSIAQEVLSSLRTVIALGIQKKELQKYSDNLKYAEVMTIRKGLLVGTFQGLTNFFTNCIFAVGIYYGTYLSRIDCVNNSPSIVIQAFFCMFYTSFAFGQAMPFFNDLSATRGAAAAVFSILEKVSTIDVLKEEGDEMKTVEGNIVFTDIHFSYPQRKEAKILNGLNLSIPAGKTVAFCGSSGGGKSTIIQLIQRFYDYDSGNITVDGKNIRDLKLSWLRSQMAVVSQEPVLFAMSIKENIRLGRLDATDEEIIEAAKMANAHNFIDHFAHKYDTMVGERGAKLSGGQKQRIAIARALIRNPRILLLDEATSALDFESEKIVQDALDRAKVGRTTIIIAHRLSTIRNADLIFVLDAGKVVESGTHEQLFALQQKYYELVTMQTKESEKEEKKNEESDESEEEIDEKDKEHGTSSRQGSIRSLGHVKIDQKWVKKNLFVVMSKIFALNKREWFFIILIVLAQLVTGAAFSVHALIFCQLFGIFTIPSEAEQEIESLTFMGILLGIAVINGLATLLYNYASAVSSSRLTKRIRIKMFESMLRQEISWHDQEENRSSILTTKLAVNASKCSGLTTDLLGIICQGVASVGVAVVVSLILNWKLALVILVFVPIAFLAGVIGGRSSINTTVNGKTNVEEGGRMTTECVDSIKTVVSLGREKYFIDEFRKLFDIGFNKTLGMLHVSAFFYSLSNSLTFFIHASAFSFGYLLIKYEGLNVTDLYRIYSTLTFSSILLGRLYSQVPDQKKSKDAADSALNIINRVSKIDSLSEEGLKPESIKGEIQFENVHFRYPTRHTPILKGLNFKANSGVTTALVGSSGCGKSTVTQLLLRFYDVEKGRILLDGTDIRKLNVNWLRTHIGQVSQEPRLFNCSILENIQFGDVEREVSFDEIRNVSKDANIDKKIENLPDKYETLVGTKGGQLSGGEKQRVAIARALLRKPKILLLDEATSALDSQSEQVVQDALDRAQVGRTCICIAHRLSTIQNSAKIIVLKEGVVIEEGSHNTLMELKGFYYSLQNQNKSKS